MSPSHSHRHDEATTGTKNLFSDPTVNGSSANASANQFGGHYYDWRIRRLRVILRETGPLSLAGARVLEMGCGHGDIGAHFLALGADVTFADARQEHLDIVSSRYHGARTLRADAAGPLSFDDNAFDLVLHLGVLYHLPPSAVGPSIREACRVGRRVWLETIVSDSDDPEYCPATREEGYDQAFAGTGSRPSPALIEAVLAGERLRWRRFDDASLNSWVHVYDWTAQNRGDYDGTQPPGVIWGHRRLWLVEKT